MCLIWTFECHLFYVQYDKIITRPDYTVHDIHIRQTTRHINQAFIIINCIITQSYSDFWTIWCGTLFVTTLLVDGILWLWHTKLLRFRPAQRIRPVVLSVYSLSHTSAAVTWNIFFAQRRKRRTFRRDGAADDDRSSGWRAAISRFNAGGRTG